MGATTTIPWCHHTFNPWRGCTKVSDGCKHCYAEAHDKRNLGGTGVRLWGDRAPRRPASEATWKDLRRWMFSAFKAQEVRRVFCGSMCDVAEDRADVIELRARLVREIEGKLGGLLPHWRFLLLSKRPQNYDRLFDWHDGPPPSVWHGTSAEDQPTVDERTAALKSQKAHLRFLSLEPLLMPVRLPLESERCVDCAVRGRAVACSFCGGSGRRPGLDWVIVGGESGTRARPCAVEWIEDVVMQCREAQVPVFVKQLGGCSFYEAAPQALMPGTGKREDPAEWPPSSEWFFDENDLPVRELPRDPFLALLKDLDAARENMPARPIEGP
jgi:protein gp37